MNAGHMQHTVGVVSRIAGIGLHSGEKVNISILPAPVDSGIRFVRTDLPGRTVIPATMENIIDTSYATTIGTRLGTVSTIEHLMAAFFGLGIDNAIVEIDGPEVPAMDGSAFPFVSVISRGGLEAQDEYRRYIEFVEPVDVSAEGKYIRIEPHHDLSVRFEIDFDHPLIARQCFEEVITRESFLTSICRARTFGFLREVEWMRSHGLALGGSLDNAVVVNDTSVLNEGGLRFPDEFVHHKVLDMIGDLYLLGAPIRGRVSACRSGHGLHHLLVKAMLDRPYAWRWTRHADIPVPSRWKSSPSPLSLAQAYAGR